MNGSMADSPGKRIDGWKAIAAYFRRDRSTVMRWARDHRLPVRRMPGGKQGSVFAFESELAAWSLTPDRTVAAEASDPPVPAETGAANAAALRTRFHPLAWIMPVALLGSIAGGAYWLGRPDPAPAADMQPDLPADPAIAADYMTARDRWARRTPRDIAQAIALYRSVIRRDPGFAPAHAGLAEAWLVYREYGEIDDPTAYAAARKAAEQAVRLDPNLPAAHRALGFITYWWATTAPTAIGEFKRAISLDDRDAQNHFWYANVLADLGEHAAAQREYSRARLLSPGSQIIEAEYACSKWQAGDDRLAMRQLSDLARRYPGDATIHNCLAWVHISGGDIVNFAREYRLAALARGEPGLLRLTERLDAAVRADPATAHRVLIADARAKIARGSMRIRETPAFFASAMGDRDELVALLTEAGNLGERWLSASVRRRIGTRWKDDPTIQRLVRDISPPPLAVQL